MRQLNWPLQYFVKLTIQCHYFVLQNESESYFLKGMSEREKMCANYHKIRRQMQTFQFQKIQNCGIYTMSHIGGYIFVSPGYHALFWLYKNVRVIVYVLLMWFTFFLIWKVEFRYVLFPDAHEEKNRIIYSFMLLKNKRAIHIIIWITLFLCLQLAWIHSTVSVYCTSGVNNGSNGALIPAHCPLTLPQPSGSSTDCWHSHYSPV